ncbi:MAG: InlB B-repeat-containing protein, partial [Clostridiales bacterium]|jgi:uncharacterized repeat protein (TIGR02543 family)|nr:InlB B-repeat-containing protein [Clostridiales bacterium]
VGVGGSSYTPTGNVTLYACWTTSVKFDPNGGEIYNPRPVGSSPYWTTGVINFSAASLFWTPDHFLNDYVRRDGYTFDGWWSDPNGGYKPIIGQTYTMGPKTWYAHWNVTVDFETYYQYTGYSTSSQSVAQGSSITLPYASASGFTFVYWSTQSQPSSDGKNGSYDVGVGGSSYTPTGNVTLYACWTTSVKFDPNGGEVYHPRPSSGTPYWSSTDVVNFSAASLFWTPDHFLNSDLVRRDGYTFDGWWSDPNGGYKPIIGQTYTMGPKTWYAHWTAITYTVTFIADGRYPGAQGGGTYTGAYGSQIQTPSAWKESDNYYDYIFNGWFIDGGSYVCGAGESYTVTYNVTLVADFESVDRETYTVEFDFDYNNLVQVFFDKHYGDKIIVPTPSTRPHYIFEWWYGGEAYVVYNGGEEHTVIGNVTFVAVWRFTLSEIEELPEKASGDVDLGSGKAVLSVAAVNESIYGVDANTYVLLSDGIPKSGILAFIAGLFVLALGIYAKRTDKAALIGRFDDRVQKTPRRSNIK